MKTAIAKSFFALGIGLLVAVIAWTLISIFGYGTTFSRTELDGLKTGMSRLEAVTQLQKRGVTEMEAIPDEGINASKDADARGGYWVRFNEKDYNAKISKHDVWRYQIPNSYSNVDIIFRQNDLISIKYRWRPFEG